MGWFRDKSTGKMVDRNMSWLTRKMWRARKIREILKGGTVDEVGAFEMIDLPRVNIERCSFFLQVKVLSICKGHQRNSFSSYSSFQIPTYGLWFVEYEGLPGVSFHLGWFDFKSSYGIGGLKEIRKGFARECQRAIVLLVSNAAFTYPSETLDSFTSHWGSLEKLYDRWGTLKFMLWLGSKHSVRLFFFPVSAVCECN